MEKHPFIWVIVLTVNVIVLDVMLFVGAKRILESFRNFRGGGRGGGPHPLPATGAVESSRGAANPKESRPVGSDKRQ